MMTYWEEVDRKRQIKNNQISVDAVLVLILQILTHEWSHSPLKDTSATVISNYKNGIRGIMCSILVLIF